MTGPNRDDEQQLEAKRSAGAAIGFGTSFAVGMVLFALAGRALDAKTGHESLFTLIGIGVGLLYGAWELWKLVARSNQETDHETPRQENSGGKPNDSRTP